MRKFEEFLAVSKQLVRADADLLDCLDDLRSALKATYKHPSDKEVERQAEIRANTFCLALGIRDQSADLLDGLRAEAHAVAQADRQESGGSS